VEGLSDPNEVVGTIEVAFDGAGVPIITLGGEIDMSNVDSLRDAIEPLIESAPAHVVFDLGNLAFMDSSGIALLLQASASADVAEVRGASAIIRRIIAATGLDEVLRVQP
jgi:anti-sigma B factor antagonist